MAYAVARAFLAVLVAHGARGCGSSGSGAPVTGVKTSDDDGYHGVLLDEPYAVPGLTLTDTDGESFDLAAQEKRMLVFFGYTNCPDICQVVMSTIVSALAKLHPRSVASSRSPSSPPTRPGTPPRRCAPTSTGSTRTTSA